MEASFIWLIEGRECGKYGTIAKYKSASFADLKMESASLKRGNEKIYYWESSKKVHRNLEEALIEGGKINELASDSKVH